MSISKNILIFLIENKKKKKPRYFGVFFLQKSKFFLFTCGGDNKTRTYDLYDVNVAL